MTEDMDIPPEPSRRILIVADGKSGITATQDISFLQPYKTLAEGERAPDFTIAPHFERGSDMRDLIARTRPDLVILSRYTAANGIDWADIAHKAGRPVLYHIDDDLLAVPMSLGEAKYRHYNDPVRLAALRANIEAADMVYVSTGPLKERFAAHHIKTPVVAGDIYCAVDPEAVGALAAPANGPVIGYMGTGGHSADLAMVMPAIVELMERIAQLQFEVFGTIKMPEELKRFGPRARHLPPVADYSDFLPSLRSLGWWVGLAPLEDNEFNRCKADTKWVEYSLAGMASVASDLPVYARAAEGGSALLAGESEAWREAILSLLLDRALRARTVKKAQDKLLRTYSHAALRAQLDKVFAKLEAIRPADDTSL